MQAKIEEVIKTYLTMPTNYAILLNGERGSGKTFFAKDKIQKLAMSTKTLEDEGKTYKFIYLSLYGVENVEEIFNLIGLELLPFLNSKVGKIGTALAKIMIRSVIAFNKLGEMEKYMKDAGSAAKQFIDTRDFVFVLDDIDRKSSSLHINSLIGWVNSMVEHDSNKVILIADNDFVIDQDYTFVKEKTIGITIEFTTSIEEQFDQLALKYASAFKIYHEYLLYYKQTIIGILKKRGTSNLRILGYFFEHFMNIFYSVYEFLQLQNNPIENPSGMNKMDCLLRFSLAISIEFRFGKVSFKNKIGLDNSPELSQFFNQKVSWEILNKTKEQKKIEDRTDLENFMEFYYDTSEYRYYQSIFFLLTGASGLDTNQLKKEIEHHFIDEPTHPAIKAYNALDHRSALDLSIKELKKMLGEILNYAYKGEYSLHFYIGVLRKAEICNQYYPLNIEYVAKRLIVALDRYKSNFKLDIYLNYHFGFSRDEKHYSIYKEIYNKIVEVNAFLLQNENKRKGIDQLSQLERSGETFYQWFNRERPSSSFEYWDVRKTLKVIQRLKCSEIYNFDGFLASYYRYFSSGDRDMLVQLATMLAKAAGSRSRKAKTLTGLISTITNKISTYAGEDYY